MTMAKTEKVVETTSIQTETHDTPAEPDTSPPYKKQKNGPSKTALELLEITPEMARETLEIVGGGVVPKRKGMVRYQPNAKGYAAAVEDAHMGCRRAQKPPTSVSLSRTRH